MADPHLQIKGGGGGHPDPEIRGEERDQKIFSALWASVWSKNKWAEARPPGPPVPLPWIRY